MTRLVVVCGEPGVGKSRVARPIAAHIDGKLLATDTIRKQLFGSNPDYTRSESQAVYDEMFARAMNELARDQSVVLDATFMYEKGRDRAELLAKDSSNEVDLSIIRVTCDDEVAKDRIQERTESGDSQSDATVDVYMSIRDRFEPVEREHTVIDNSGEWIDTIITLREKDW